MNLAEVKGLLDAEVLCNEDMLDEEVLSACGSDLMSDVLAFVKDQSLLMTGLMNQQVVRTAEMMDMKCIIFVRGKTPEQAIVDLASNRGLVVMTSKYRMYEACGRLYAGGLV